MGTITVNVDDKTEKEFRQTAGSIYGKRKGYLGEAITDAMELWIRKESENNTTKALEMLRKGLNLGKLNYKERSELHDR